MKSRINILFLLFVYLLNVAHDIQPHEHEHYEKIRCQINVGISTHYQIQDANPFNHANSSEISNLLHNDHELPFQHCHLLDYHDIFQIRILQNSIEFTDLSENCQTISFLRLPEIPQEEFSNKCENNLYQSLVAASLSPRAPPTFS
jgi:hypothetical protein